MTLFTECWARDGIQAERPVSTEDKLTVIEAASRMGASRVEVASFSKPSDWPQAADAAEVVRRFTAQPGVEYSAYVPNVRALERLTEADDGAHKVSLVLVAVAASDSYNLKNVGRPLHQAMADIESIIRDALAAGFEVLGCVGTAWTCPIEGPVPEEHVLTLGERMLRSGARELILGDTTGEANVRTTRKRIAAVKDSLGVPVSGHFHDARGTALSNALAALDVGVDRIEGSLGGVGGHPPDADQLAASPNLCTEDFVSTALAAGFELPLELDKVMSAGRAAQGALGRPLLSRVQRNGLPASQKEVSA